MGIHSRFTLEEPQVAKLAETMETLTGLPADLLKGAVLGSAHQAELVMLVASTIAIRRAVDSLCIQLNGIAEQMKSGLDVLDGR